MAVQQMAQAGIDPAALVNLIPQLFGSESTQSASLDPQQLARSQQLMDQLLAEAGNDQQALVDSILQRSAIDFAPVRGAEISSGGYNSTTLKLLQNDARARATAEAANAVLQAKQNALRSASELQSSVNANTRTVTTNQKGNAKNMILSTVAGMGLKKMMGGKSSITVKDAKNMAEPALNKFGKFSPKQMESAAGSDESLPSGSMNFTGGASTGAGSVGPAGSASYGDFGDAPDLMSSASYGDFGDLAGFSQADMDVALGIASEQAAANPMLRSRPVEESVDGQSLDDGPEVKPLAPEADVMGTPVGEVAAGASSLSTAAPQMSRIPSTLRQDLGITPSATPELNMSIDPSMDVRGGGVSFRDSISLNAGDAAGGGDAAISGASGAEAYGDFGSVAESAGETAGAAAADSAAGAAADSAGSYGDFGGVTAEEAGDIMAGSSFGAGTGQIPIVGPALQVAAGEYDNAGANVAATYGLTAMGIPFPVAAFVGSNLAAPIAEVASDVIEGVGDMFEGVGSTIGDAFGTVICTELVRQGLMDKRTQRENFAWAARHINKTALRGYREGWGPVFVRYMQRSEKATSFARVVLASWSHWIRGDKTALLGAALVPTVFVPSYIIGRYLEIKEWLTQKPQVLQKT